MASEYDKLWGGTTLDPNGKPQSVAGLFDVGFGLLNRNQGMRDSAALLNAARGPVYNPAMNASAGMLAQAGNFDPQAFATQRFGQQQALVAPVQQKQQDDLMRSLYSQGTLGISNYNPGVEGFTPDATSMTLQIAA